MMSSSIFLKPFLAVKNFIDNLAFKFVDKHFEYGYKEDFQNIFDNAIPMMFGNLFQMMFQIVSILFCGHIGPDELDATSLAFTMINVCGQTSVIGLLSACDTIFPQVFAGKNKKIMGIYLQKALLISMIWCLPVIGLLTNSRLLISLVERNSNIVKLADRFVLIYLPSIYTSVLINLQTKYLQAQNIIRPLVIIYGCGLALHICLNATFVYGLKMGVEGSALSIDLSLLFVAVGMFYYSKKKKLYEATWDGWTTACLYDWSSFLKLGVPGFLSLLFEWSNFEIGTFSASAVSDIELGALAITQQVLFVCFMVPLSIATSGNIRIGQLLGGNSPDRAKNASKVLVTICAAGAIIVCILLLSFSKFIPYIFSNSAPIIEKTQNLIIIIAFFHLLDAGQGTFGGILRSVGAQFYIFILMVIGYYVIGSPIGLSLLLTTKLTSYGYFIGVSIGTFLIVFAQILYAIRIDWSKEAHKAYELTLAALPADTAVTATNINADIKGMANPNFDLEIKTVNLPADEKNDSAPKSVNAVVSNDDEMIEAATIPPGASLRLALLKRTLMLVGFVALFIGLTSLRAIQPFNHYNNNNQNVTVNNTQDTIYAFGENNNNDNFSRLFI